MGKIIDRLDRRFRRFGVANVTPLLIAGQVVCYFVIQANPAFYEKLVIDRQLVLEQGQVWRLFSFLLLPPQTNVIFAFFAWYLFYLMGTALEMNWGAFRYNLYLLVGYVATVAAALALPGGWTTNVYLYGSVFLAFAFLYPDFQLMLMFILPVKVRWLAMIQWIMYFWRFAVGDWPERVLVLAAVCNFLLFFSADIIARIRDGKRRRDYQRRQIVHRDKPFHRCEVCGITEKTHPQMDFRYCSKCSGAHEYCDEHLRSHEHISEKVPSSPEKT